MIIAVIPARGGSKRLPGKNLRPLAGKPLIAWSIEAALASNCIDRVIVSTEDDDIAEAARRYGADVPFKRPLKLAGDEVMTPPVIRHAVEAMSADLPSSIEFVLTLQATSPLRTGEDIDEVVRIARSNDADAVISIAKASIHPRHGRVIDSQGRLVPVAEFESLLPLPYQQENAVYYPNGAIYLSTIDSLFAHDTLFPPGTFPYVMDDIRSVDIDTEWDFLIAEYALGRKGKGRDVG